MINSTTIYWVLILDNIKLVIPSIVGILTFLFLFASIIFIINRCMDIKERFHCPKFFYWLFPLLTILFLIISISTVFIPSTKQMAAIIIASKIINSDFVQKDLPKETKELYELTKEYFKQKVKENKEN